VLTFSRGRHVCIVNLSKEDVPLPAHETLLLTSRPLAGDALQPDTAAWLLA
jgi:alpha-glucosidase